jgi:cytochrome c553
LRSTIAREILPTLLPSVTLSVTLSLTLSVTLSLTLSLTATAATAASRPFEDTIEQRLQACVVCHGERGGGIKDAAFPRLAGQPAAYLAAQMKAFRDGVRTYAPMNFLMSRQSDEYFAEIAGYFSQQTPDPAVIDARRATSPERAAFEAGRLLVHEGRPVDRLPACVACHGAALAGTLPAIPALAGMPRDFLIEQVGSWKSGAHRSPEPNCMAEIAKRMSGADIVAAATWLSLQQPDHRPESRAGPLPIACGTR